MSETHRQARWCRIYSCNQHALSGSEFCAGHQHAANEPTRPGVGNHTRTAPRKRVSALRRRVLVSQPVRRPDPGTSKAAA